MNTPPVAARLRRDDLRESPIRRIMELADRRNIVAMGLDPDDVISFAGGWVDHEAPEALRDEYARIAADPATFHRLGAYSPTRGLPQLRESLVQLDRALYATADLRREHVLVGASSTQLTFSLFVALLDPGDRVLLLDPTYANIPPQLDLCVTGVETLSLPVLDAEAWSYFGDVDAIVEALARGLEAARPRLVLLSSPDNPTGQLIPDPAFDAIVALAAEHDCFVAVDYAYRAQYYSAEPPAHFAASPARHPNLIRIHSNSKWCRGLGRRLGWVEAAAEVIEALELVQQSTALCPDTLHQAALARYLDAALADGSLVAYLEESRERYSVAATRTIEQVDVHLGMRRLRPQGGLYTVVDVGGAGDRFVLDVLENTGVIFVPGSGFGPSLANAIRVSFGPLVRDLGRIEEGFARVGAYLRARKGPASPV